MTGHWYIYGLHSGDESKIRYVGYTKCPHERRLQHLSAARCGHKDQLVYEWVRALVAGGGTLHMIVLEEGEGDSWKEAEQRWIAHFPRLLNVAVGGTMPAIPAASRKRAGEKLKTRVFTPQHRQRISDAKTGKKRPDMVVRNTTWLPERLRGKKMNLSAEERARRAASIPEAGKVWANMSAEDRARRGANISAGLRRSWERRRSQVDG